MKLILVTLLSITFFGGNLFAQEQSKLSSLNYSLPQGEWFTGASYTSLKFDYSYSVAFFGSKFIDSTVTANALKLSLGYGINEQFELMLSMNAVGNQTEDIKFGPASTINGTTQSYKNEGASNPLIRGRYQFKDEKDSDSFFTFGYLPILTKAKSSTSTVTGNMAESQSYILLGVNFVSDTGSSQSSFSVDRQQKLAGESEGPTSTTKVTDGHLTTFKYEYQKQLENQWFFGGALSLLYTEKSKTDTNGSTTDTDARLGGEFDLTAGYDFSDKFYAKFSYAIVSNLDRDVKSGTTTFKEKTGTTTGYMLALGATF